MENAEHLIDQLLTALEDSLISISTVGGCLKSKELIDLGITLQLVLVLYNESNLEELKVFLKNYMLGESSRIEDATTSILRMPICLN